MWLRKPNGPLVIAFLHGVLSDRNCWTHEGGIFWPDLLTYETELQRAGIFVFEYKTGFFSGTYSLGDVVDALKAEMELEGILGFAQIIFVCHSMGGIVARRFIVQNQMLLAERGISVGLFLIASPSLGSRYANWISPIARAVGHTQADILRFSQTNSWLMDLDRDFLNLKESNKISIRGRELVEDTFIIARFLLRRQVVEPFSGARYFGDSIKIQNSDHFSISKVANATDLQHRLLVAFILDTPPAPARQQQARAGDALSVIDGLSVAGSSSPQPPEGGGVVLDSVPEFHDLVVDRDEIDKLLALAQSRLHVSIEGISGSGKTYLASALIRIGLAELGLSGAFWYQCCGGDTLDEILGQVGGVEINPTWSQMARARALMASLVRRRTLLVIDDMHRADHESAAVLIEAASSVSHPCRLITTSQKLVSATSAWRDIARYTPSGFDRQRIKLLLKNRGLSNLTTYQLSQLATTTDGLPFAVSLFASLIQEFGYDAGELLHGGMSTDDRLLDWCERALSHVSRDERQLFTGLSLIEGVIDRRLAECVAVSLNIERFKPAFERLLSWHLLRRNSIAAWTMHRILMVHCANIISPVTRHVIARALADGHKQRALAERQNGNDLAALGETAVAIRYFIEADDIDRAEREVGRIASEAKEIGAFGLLRSLIEQISVAYGIESITPWVAYHYAHALLTLGKIRQANTFLSTYLKRPEIKPLSAAFSCSRLLAETYLDLGRPDLALDILEESDVLLSRAAPSLTAQSQYWLVKARALLDLGRSAAAEKAVDAAIKVTGRGRDARAQAVIEMHLSLLAQCRKDLAGAMQLARSANDAFKRLRDPRGLVWSGVHIGKIEAANGMINEGVKTILYWIRENIDYEFAIDRQALYFVRDHAPEEDQPLIGQEIERTR